MGRSFVCLTRALKVQQGQKRRSMKIDKNRKMSKAETVPEKTTELRYILIKSCLVFKTR